MSKELEKVKKEVEQIKRRNERVEADKAWETSAPRKLFILFTTYVLVVLILYYAGNEQPFVNAIIPAIGYFLSTLSLRLFKSYWMRRKQKF